MKVKKQTFVLLLTMLVGISFLSAQNSKEQIAKVVKKAITSKDYKIDADTYIPPYEDSKPLNFPNSIEIRNDTVFSKLFYFGQIDIPHGVTGNQLNFQAPLEKYAINIDKKGNIHIKFSAHTAIDHVNFKVDVYSDGSAKINIFMRHSQSISYSGKLYLRRENM